MSFNQILHHFLREDLTRSVEIFAPELVLCLTIILLLLGKMLNWQKRFPLHVIALLGSTLVFLGTASQSLYMNTAVPTGLAKNLFDVWALSAQGVGTPGGFFTGMLWHDEFGLFLRILISLFLVLLVTLTILTEVPDNSDSQDFYTLVFGAALGMMLAVSTNHLLVLFFAVEMMSLPSYLLIAFNKGKPRASEGSLKYVLYGAGAGGVMLYGISLIAGITGTADMHHLAERSLLAMGPEGLVQSNASAMTLMLGITLTLCGLAFKLALAPFHFWAPDAFEGAFAEVGAFLSVAAKIGAFGLLIRFLLAFQGTAPGLSQICLSMGLLLGLIGIITTTYGNLAAYVQTNIKRLLAYSTIAQSGYTIMAVAGLMILLSDPTHIAGEHFVTASKALEALIYYLVVYLFMNLVAFAVVAFVRNLIFSEEINDYSGLFHAGSVVKTLCICMTLSLISLIGIPPLAGAFGKLMIFSSVLNAGSLHWLMWIVLLVGVLNSILSVFYYMRLVKVMFFTNPEKEVRRLNLPTPVGLYVLLITSPLLLLGATPLMSSLSRTARAAAISVLQ